jgi:outer membrane lipoprotein SlyB
MNAEAGQSRFGVELLAGLLAIAALFAGSAPLGKPSTATSVARVIPNALAGSAADDPPAPADQAPPAVGGAQPATLPAGSGIRKKVRCAACGVVESVRRVDRREIAGRVCSAADSDPFWIDGVAHDGEYDGVAALADTVDGVLAGRPGAKRMTVSSSYQFVVRFSDGSRQVFNEAAARTLQSGERVLVIAGVNPPTE